MIPDSHHRYLPPTPYSEMKESSVATASKDIKFGGTFRRICPVFKEKVLDEANKAIVSDRGYGDFVADPDKSSLDSEVCSLVRTFNGRYCLGLISNYWPPKKEEVVVEFDRNCKIIDSSNLLKHLNTTNEALIELTKEGLEILASEFSLGNHFVDIKNVYIIRNHIPCEGSLKPNRWGSRQGQYTLEMQMNDDSSPKKDASYYEGGGLETAEFASNSLDTGILPNVNTIESHRLEQNSGYVYSKGNGLILKHQTVTYVSNKDGKPLEKRLFGITVSKTKDIRL